MVAMSGTAVGSLFVGASVAHSEIEVLGLGVTVVWAEVGLLAVLIALLVVTETLRRRAVTPGRG